MPGRQSHGSAPSRKAKARVNSKKRTLDAFAIASHENPEKLKIRQHRLGASEGGGRPKKRSHDEEDDGEDEEPEPSSKKQRKGPNKGRFDELDMEEGSDSEGNEWKLGQVDSDDDSDLDSDEAFGESDEERYEGFAFSGSSKKKAKVSHSQSKSLNLDEDDNNGDSDSELEEGDLGEDAVDLATMLDDTEGSDDGIADTNNDQEHSTDEEDDDTDDTNDTDDESSISSRDDDETSDPAKAAALRQLILNLSQTDESNRPSVKQNSAGASEYSKPSDFGLTSTTKLTLEDLGLPTIKDHNVRKSLKLLASDSNEDGKRKSASKRLEVPLAKRQQDRLDRSAAYDKSKEALDRWTDTVKHNRRADHLIFPLPNNDTASAHANTQLQPTGNSKPFNQLEAAIQNILEESGLATQDGKDDEDRIREFEELETNKMTIEEVKSRRDQLRMARELLFREEAKSKRIKKIKSKSYRKVHRKQREKEERLNKEALEEGGFVPSEDEVDAQDRRRAMERMGAKHRGSKWAKSTKEIGRAAWDVDARAGIADMARRDEELRKRVEGKAIRREFEDDSDLSSSDADDLDDNDAEQARLLRQLNKVGDASAADTSGPGSKLSNMKFMLKAEAAKKKENDAMVESIRKEIAGEETSSEEEEGDVGRRIFGPSSKNGQDQRDNGRDGDSQEPVDIDNEGGHDTHDKLNAATSSSRSRPASAPSRALRLPSQTKQHDPSSGGGAWSTVEPKSASINDAEAKRRRHKRNDALEVEELDISQAAVIATKPKPRARKDAAKPSMLDVSDESGDENPVQLPFAIRDQELIKRAFAGADVVGEFDQEKRQMIEDDDEKVIDNTLPGWGSWTGDGLSKKAKARNKGRFLTKSEGIKEENRKDAKLQRVIINEKRVKKNGKYLAANLPHPFETRQQYERSLRLPVGPEWGTKETFQDATKPRILLKQGIIAPMSKPLL